MTRRSNSPFDHHMVVQLKNRGLPCPTLTVVLGDSQHEKVAWQKTKHAFFVDPRITEMRLVILAKR